MRTKDMETEKLDPKEQIQMSLTISYAWRVQLERLSKIYSFEENTTITVQDLIRQAIQEKYQLIDEITQD